MGINSTKLLSVLSTTLTFTALLPGIAYSQLPLPDSTTAPSSPTPAQVNQDEQHLEKQALLRERNRRIIEILDENQKNKFYEALRKRRKLNRALDDLNLKPEQETRINAIISDYNGKMRSVGTGQPPQSTPPTTAP